MLPFDRSYHLRSGNSIQKKTKRRQVYYSINFITHILSRCQNCKLWKNNMVIDIEIESKIKRALADIMSKEIKNKLTNTKPHTNVTSIIIEKVKTKR